MQSSHIDLNFSTKHVSYFKKLVTNQYALCSDIKMKYDKDCLMFYANSTAENIFLTMKINVSFFDTLLCEKPNVIRLNMYHFYKIIKHVTSFRYKSIQLIVYGKETHTQCHWVHIVFHTENRKDTFHTRGYPVKGSDDLMISSNISLASDFVQMNLNGKAFSHALHQFDNDMFKTLQFSLRLNVKNKCDLCVSSARDQHLLLKGRTDVISGKVIIKTNVKMQVHEKALHKLKQQKYSLFFLRKSLQFFKLSEKTTFTLTFYPEFKIIILRYALPYNVNIEIVLPDIPCERWSESVVMATSDSDDC